MLNPFATLRQDGLIDVDVGTAQVLSVKDIIVNDAGTFKRASDLADQGTEALNQRMLARLFVGVSEGAKLAAETWRTRVPVQCSFDAEHEFPCESETHAIGDWLTVDEAASGTALEAQELVKTTDRAAAIFECVRADAAASTTVRVRRLRQDLDQRGQVLTDTLAGTLTMTKNSPRMLVLDPGGANRKVLLPPEADSFGVAIDIANTADMAEDLQIRDDGDATTICTISQNERGRVFCNGVAWYGHTGAQT